MLGTPARFARLIFTIVRRRFFGANSSIQIAVPTATGMEALIVTKRIQNEPRIAGLTPALSAKREG